MKSSALFKGLLGIAFLAAIVASGLFSGPAHGAGLYFLIVGSIAAAFMGFSGREIGTAFRFAAGRPGTGGEAGRAAYFWEAASRNSWILGVLGSTLNFTFALGRESGGMESVTLRMVQALSVGLYGLILAVVCLVPALKIRGAMEDGESARAVSGMPPVSGRILGYVLFAAVLATTALSVAGGKGPHGPLSLEKVMLHWPAILIVVGGTIALAVFAGAGAGPRALTLGFSLTGLVSLLMGFIQALSGFVHSSVQEIASAVVFIISSCSFAMLGLLTVGAPLEDRAVMEGRRARPGRFSRMLWIVFPLVSYIFLILTFIMVITPMKRAPGK